MIHPASETQEKERLKVKFPYSAKSRAVIVGGHETWAKAIKPLLKNVRWDTLHKEGVPPDFDISGFMLFSSDSVAFLPYGVGLLPYLRG